MELARLTGRAALVTLAFGLMQGCTALPQKAVAGEESILDQVTEEMYTREVYLTGSRIPRKVDVRRSIEDQSAVPLKVVKVSD
jgi:hypothetical protein